MKLNQLWHSCDSRDWEDALSNYWRQISPEFMQMEKELNQLNPMDIQKMNGQEFYNFLLVKYFPWKYTAKNRLATTTIRLKGYRTDNNFNDLEKIKSELFRIDLTASPKIGLETCAIRGLGIAGRSGLLSLLFPKHYGTVDQFVVKSLRKVEGLTERKQLENMNPEGLTMKDGVLLIQIMRNKAQELNTKFNTDFWTPRKIDMILWACRETD